MNGAGETARKPLKYTSKTQVCWHSRNRLQNSDHLSFVYEKTKKDGGTTGETFLSFACTFYILYMKQVTWVRDSFLKTCPDCPVLSCLWPGRSPGARRAGFSPRDLRVRQLLPPSFADVRGISFSRRWSRLVLSSFPALKMEDWGT